ncbi:MAG: hypothetical protein ACK5OS_05480 [Chryseotalea sp.]|jgi:hypothetical protein
MNDISNYWTNVLSTSKVDRHGVYGLSDLHKIPNVPGLYAWYIAVSSANFSDYYKIFKQKKVTVKIEGVLQDKYHGEIQNIYNDKNFPSAGIDYDLCEVASLAFSPPLYIGISIDLRKRLIDHSSELTKVLYGKLPLPSPLPIGKTEFDTIYESAHFALRIGHTIVNYPTVDLASFKIKTLELPKSFTWQDLQRVERYMNRTYIPVYGRK